jgi:hypothetical protein
MFQEMHVQTRELLQTIATLEMYRAQREVANYMELAYLRLADHPDQARDVRKFVKIEEITNTKCS